MGFHTFPGATTDLWPSNVRCKTVQASHNMQYKHHHTQEWIGKSLLDFIAECAVRPKFHL